MDPQLRSTVARKNKEEYDIENHLNKSTGQPTTGALLDGVANALPGPTKNKKDDPKGKAGGKGGAAGGAATGAAAGQ